MQACYDAVSRGSAPRDRRRRPRAARRAARAVHRARASAPRCSPASRPGCARPTPPASGRARRERPPGALRRVDDEHLRPAQAGAHPGRGLPTSGTTTVKALPRPPRRHRRQLPRPRPPGARRRRHRPSCRRSATSRTSSPPSPRSPWPSGCSTLLGASTGQGLLRQLRHRGQRGRAQADPAHRPHPRRRDRGRLPRPHDGRPRADRRRRPTASRSSRSPAASPSCRTATPTRSPRP